MDCSPPRSSVHGIFQARILEWVAISFSRGSSGPRNQTWVSCIAGEFLHCQRNLLPTELQGKPLWPYMGEFISGLFILSCWSKCLSLLLSGNFWNQDVCNFQLRYSFSIIFWLWAGVGVPCDSTWISGWAFLCLQKNITVILTGIILTLWFAPSSNDLLTVSSLLVHEPKIPFHLLENNFLSATLYSSQYKPFIFLVKSTPKYCILFDAIINWTVFLISFWIVCC